MGERYDHVGVKSCQIVETYSHIGNWILGWIAHFLGKHFVEKYYFENKSDVTKRPDLARGGSVTIGLSCVIYEQP